MDLDGLGSNPNGAAQTGVEMAKSLATQVYDQAAEDFPPATIKWIKSKNVTWEKRTVSLSEVDFSNVKNWKAFKNKKHVDEFVNAIKTEGYDKCVILVKTPGSKKLVAVDGHHRLLAWRKLKLPVPAYIATVTKDSGAWDKMHAAQKRELEDWELLLYRCRDAGQRDDPEDWELLLYRC